MPRSRSVTSGGRCVASSPLVASDMRIWPPWATAATRAAWLMSMPTMPPPPAAAPTRSDSPVWSPSGDRPGEGFEELVEPEVPSRIELPATTVTQDNVDEMIDLGF